MKLFEVSSEARKLFKKAGWSLFVFMMISSVVEDVFLYNVTGYIWKFTLMSTPDGYISNANFVSTLIHCPWIIPVALIIVVMFAGISMWQVTAVIMGVALIYEGKRITVYELLKESFIKVIKSFRPYNWSILLYSLLIVPFADIYQTSRTFNAYVVPEYIQDFIDSKTSLVFISMMLTAVAVYMALRWFYVLPSFILKKNNFIEARKESHELTKKGLLTNGIKITVYNILENIRLVILPFVLMTLTVIILMAATEDMVYSFDLIYQIGVNIGGELIKSAVGSLVYISTMCYLFMMYVHKLKNKGMDVSFNLPELKKQAKPHNSVIGIEFVFAILISLLVSVLSIVTIFAAQISDSVVLELFARTEIVAHKGYSSKAPENTMMAFDLAASCDDVDVIELDVWNSKDGIPVVIHNESIFEATGIKGNIYDYTYEELCDISAPYSMDKKKYADARIPSLEEVLKKYAGVKSFLIEIKGYQKDNTLVSNIVELIHKYDTYGNCIIHSGDYSALKAVKEIDPDIKCGLIQALVTGNCYDLPYVDFISVEHTFINGDMINKLHQKGKKIYVWTVNYESSAKELKTLGVDAIITDYPEQIAEYVASTNNLVETALDRMKVKELESTFDEGNY